MKDRLTPEDVRSFYNRHTDDFVRVYGDVIQAYRTKDPTKILFHEMMEMGMEDGQIVLDAGCGVCGPAVFFANNKAVCIEALTISEAQYNVALDRIEHDCGGTHGKIELSMGDYHQLSSLYENEFFDLIYFLESFGHSNDREILLNECWKVLKPGGRLYIKDLFRRIGYNSEMQEKIDIEIDKINSAYYYQVSDLEVLLTMVRKQGFVIEFVKTIDIKLEDFENLTVSNDFQELTGIGKIEDWDSYVFPVEFYEVRLYKPVFNLQEGLDKYFLQNLLAYSNNHSTRVADAR